MKNLFFSLIATFSLLSNAQTIVSIENDNLLLVSPDVEFNKTTINKSLGLYCFNIGPSVGIKIKGFLEFSLISATVEICCWPRSAHSPGYKCDLGTNIGRRDAYINIKTIDPKISDIIKSCNATKIEITGLASYSDGKFTYTVKEGDYEILDIDEEKFLKVTLQVAKKN